jgi:hypothetical protein
MSISRKENAQMTRYRIFSLCASLAVASVTTIGAMALGGCATPDSNEPNETSGEGGAGSGGEGGAGVGGAGGDGGSGGVMYPIDCMPEWDPSSVVRALGRIRPDGSEFGVLYPNPTNIGEVHLYNSEMVIAFKSAMPNADYVVITSPMSAAKVVTFLPTYVPFDITPQGFKVALYNSKGEPMSWLTASTTEMAFVVY